MGTVVSAVFPVFALLVLGHVARRSGFLPDDFWQYAERGTYFVLFPSLLVAHLAQAQLDWRSALWLIIAALLLPLCAASLSFLFRPVLRLAPADFTSFFQGVVRFNTYVGLALVALMPAPALVLAALVVAILIPVVNVLCVLVFATFTQAQMRWPQVLLALLKNPLIIACLLGVVLNLLPVKLPAVLMDVIRTLGQVALPMGLLAVGAGLRLQALREAGASFFVSSLLRLLVLPLVAWGLAGVLGLSPVETAVLVVFAALPTAPSAYILARQLGGNAALMAGIITGQTLLSLLTLPVVLALILP